LISAREIDLVETATRDADARGIDLPIMEGLARARMILRPLTRRRNFRAFPAPSSATAGTVGVDRYQPYVKVFRHL